MFIWLHICIQFICFFISNGGILLLWKPKHKTFKLFLSYFFGISDFIPCILIYPGTKICKCMKSNLIFDNFFYFRLIFNRIISLKGSDNSTSKIMTVFKHVLEIALVAITQFNAEYIADSRNYSFCHVFKVSYVYIFIRVFVWLTPEGISWG